MTVRRPKAALAAAVLLALLSHTAQAQPGAASPGQPWVYMDPPKAGPAGVPGHRTRGLAQLPGQLPVVQAPLLHQPPAPRCSRRRCKTTWPAPLSRPAAPCDKARARRRPAARCGALAGGRAGAAQGVLRRNTAPPTATRQQEAARYGYCAGALRRAWSSARMRKPPACRPRARCR